MTSPSAGFGSSATELPADLEAAAKRVQELSQQVSEKAKANGLAFLEGYERVLKNLLDLEEQVARKSGTEWARLASTHADFVRESSEMFFSSLRGRLES